MSINRIIVIFLFCSLATIVRGQNELDKVVARNYELKTDIEDLNSDIEQLLSDIQAIRDKLKADSLELGKIAQLIKTLEYQSSEEVLGGLAVEIDSLTRYNATLLDSVKSIDSAIAAKKRLLSKRKTELQNMTAFSNVQKKRQMETNIQFLNQRYSSMSVVAIQKMINESDIFSAIDTYADYKKRLLYTLANKQLFDEGHRVICSPYDENRVILSREKLLPLLQLEEDNPERGVYLMSKEQFDEMDSLDIRLSRFRGGMEELKNVIASINSNEEVISARNEMSDSAKEVILSIVRGYIVPVEGTDAYRVYQRYFLMIPFLKKMLNEYGKEIETAPFVYPTETEKLINNLTIN